MLPSCDAVNGRYVSRVIFDFYTTPLSGAEIWLYTFQRNGTTSQFTQILSYLIPSALVATGSGSDGIQIINLNSTALPVAPGQYLGVGINSRGGNLYHSPVSGQYYLFTADGTFSALSTRNYINFETGGSATVAFDVVAF